jgi:hypothetical protein
MPEFPPIVAHTYSELADALAELKNFRGLSNEGLEQLTGLAGGAVDKILGPARVKGIGKNSLAWLLAALGGRLVLEIDPDQDKLMASRWEGRNQSQVRVRTHPVSSHLIKLVKPVIFHTLAKRAVLARLTKLSRRRRKEIARNAGIASGRARRRQARRNGNGHANGHRNGH